MGNKCSSIYANNFMSIFENYIYYLIKNKLKLDLRYIDSIFIISIGTFRKLKQFIIKINQVHLSIKIGFNYSKQCKLLWHNSQKIFSRWTFHHFVLKKTKTDHRTYIHKKLEHSQYLKHSLLYAQDSSLKWICAEDQDVWANCDLFSKTLVERLQNVTAYQSNSLRTWNIC